MSRTLSRQRPGRTCVGVAAYALQSFRGYAIIKAVRVLTAYKKVCFSSQKSPYVWGLFCMELPTY